MRRDEVPILSVDHATVAYATREGMAKAVDDVTLSIFPGSIVGLVGESGSGKSTLAAALMCLLPSNASLLSGHVLLNGKDLYQMSEQHLRRIRWAQMSMVFQSAMATLNPVLTVGQQFREIFRIHEPRMTREDQQRRMEELLGTVRIHTQHLRNYSHELSGGMRQRIALAMAIALDPELVIMDEPTTALDAVVQHEILEEIRRIQQIKRFAVLFISHDLRLVRYISSEILVMYAGKIVESAPIDVFTETTRHHPYTRGLLDSIPQLRDEQPALHSIPGSPPGLTDLPVGCAFHPRCPYVQPPCLEAPPPLEGMESQLVACYEVDNIEGRRAHA